MLSIFNQISNLSNSTTYNSGYELTQAASSTLQSDERDKILISGYNESVLPKLLIYTSLDDSGATSSGYYISFILIDFCNNYCIVKYQYTENIAGENISTTYTSELSNSQIIRVYASDPKNIGIAIKKNRPAISNDAYPSATLNFTTFIGTILGDIVIAK